MKYIFMNISLYDGTIQRQAVVDESELTSENPLHEVIEIIFGEEVDLSDPYFKIIKTDNSMSVMMDENMWVVTQVKTI